MAIHMKELMYVKIHGCTDGDMNKLTCMKEIFQAKMTDYDATTVLLECVQTENRNNDFIRLLETNFPGRIEIVRGGSVAIEAVSISER